MSRRVASAFGLVTAAAFGLTTACTIGAPPGFSDGESWSIPLVGPLENGRLIVPVFVNDHGPYLMVIDPDAGQSALDEALVSELGLYSGLGPRLLDESDTSRPVRVAEVRALRLGTLTVRSRVVVVSKLGAFAVAGRQIRGLVGRDIIADSLVFGFDRDRGSAYLATRNGFARPAAASVIGYELLSNDLPIDPRPPGRRLVDARVGAGTFALHLDLGETRSQLRADLWSKAGLAPVPASGAFVDELGTTRKLTGAGLASAVTIGPIQRSQTLFWAYDDRRWDEDDIDGTLGLDAFVGYKLWADWDEKDLYLVPRSTDDQLAVRIDRWNSPLITSCEREGCVTVAFDAPVEPPVDGTPPPPPMLRVTRDASTHALALEVLLEAIDATSNAPLGVPRMIANLPSNVDTAAGAVTVDTAGGNTRWVVRDVSPFPRACAGGGACLMQLAE